MLLNKALALATAMVAKVGDSLGDTDGDNVSVVGVAVVGDIVGSSTGDIDGCSEGCIVGDNVGCCVGYRVPTILISFNQILSD